MSIFDLINTWHYFVFLVYILYLKINIWYNTIVSLEYIMEIVNYFYNINSDFWTKFLTIFEVIGTEKFFFIMFLFVYWIYDKKSAFKMAGIYLGSVLINFSLKNIIRRQRPYPKTNDSYSMPSGHCQSYSVVVSSSVIFENRNRKMSAWKWVVSTISLLLVGCVVAIDRMYFGRHFLSDCLVGLALGVVCAIGFSYLMDWFEKISKISLLKFLLFALPLPIILYFVSTFTDIFGTEGTLRIYVCIGIYIGILLGYFTDIKTLDYKPSGSTKTMFLKVLLGALIMFSAYFLLNKTITLVYLIPLNYAILGFLGTYIVPLVMVKAFEESVNVGETK